MVVFAAIAPHGGIVFDEAATTRAAMEELGRRLESAQPDVTVVLTPHNVHVDGSFAVLTAAKLIGTVEERELACEVDRGLAAEVLHALRTAGLPALGVSYGSNHPALAEAPMDWGTLIPLWFLGRDTRPVVVVAPSRERPLAEHVQAGAAIAAACEGRRAALVASADHGHAHDADGPFGFDPAAAEYDERTVELVRANRLGDALGLGEIVEAASADSLWQLLMLHGALGDGFEAELLSYEAPTYFGMLCAAFTSRA